jgi:hypothetical protein
LRRPATADAPRADKGVAAGLFQTFTHVGGAIVLAVLIVAFAARSHSAAASGASLGAATAAGIHTALVVDAALLAAGALVGATPLRDRSIA